jgi:hypothetical protein
MMHCMKFREMPEDEYPMSWRIVNPIVNCRQAQSPMNVFLHLGRTSGVFVSIEDSLDGRRLQVADVAIQSSRLRSGTDKPEQATGWANERSMSPADVCRLE